MNIVRANMHTHERHAIANEQSIEPRLLKDLIGLRGAIELNDLIGLRDDAERCVEGADLMLCSSARSRSRFLIVDLMFGLRSGLTELAHDSGPTKER